MGGVDVVLPEAREALARLVSSPSIIRAPRVHAVLKFLVEELLAGRAEAVNEQRIGECVLGRPPGFNPAEDNIVRVTVGNLRARLEEYYRTEGRNDLWVLDIPKGRYVPAVHLRDGNPHEPVRGDSKDAGFAGQHLAGAETGRPLPSRGPDWKTRRAGVILAVAIALLITNAVLAYWLFRTARSPQAAGPRGLLPQLFRGRSAPLTVVVTDENLYAYRLAYRKLARLDAYLNRSHTEPAEGLTPVERGALAFARSRHATSAASAAVAARLQSALAPSGVQVRHPSEISMQDIENDSVVLLGGPWVNPWVQLFESRLDFRTVVPENAGLSEIRVAQPAAGEQAVYAAHTDGASEVSYLRVAVQPNHSGKGRVVLIGGIRSASQEAGCEFLLDPARVPELLRRFNSPDVAHLPPFELLLEVRGVARTPVDLKIVASRPRATEQR